MAVKLKCEGCNYKNNTLDDLFCQMCGQKLSPHNRWNDTTGAGAGEPGGAGAAMGVRNRSVERGAARAVATKQDGPSEDQIVYVGDFAIVYLFLTAHGDQIILSPGEVFTFGRGEAADHKVDDRSISRRHARIHWSGNPPAPEVLDLDSKNGILVNGQPVRRKALEDDDVLSFGSFTATLKVVPANDIEGSLPQVDRLSATAATAQRMIGEVKLISIPWLLQHLEAQKESGTLVVYGEDVGGYVAMISGVAIAAAYGTELEKTGIEAIELLGKIRNGRFAFSPKADAAPQSIGRTMAEIFGRGKPGTGRQRRRPPPPPRRGGGGGGGPASGPAPRRRRPPPPR